MKIKTRKKNNYVYFCDDTKYKNIIIMYTFGNRI